MEAPGQTAPFLGPNLMIGLFVATPYIATFASSYRSHRNASRWTWPLLLYSFVFFVTVSSIGMLRCPSGREFVWNLESAHRASLIGVPLSQRGHFWYFREAVDAVFVQFPLFFWGYNSNRLDFFNDMSKVNGKVTPFVGGVALHSHSEVVKVMEHQNQPRGRFYGAREALDICLVCKDGRKVLTGAAVAG